MVQLRSWQLLRFPPHLWLHYDDTSGIVLATLTIGMSSSEKLSLEYAVKSFMQLFINYKLKSVAHLPWRMMTYKVDISERGSTNNIFLRL